MIADLPCLVELRLRALAPITGLPHYPGPHLSAMLRIGMRAAGYKAEGLHAIPRDLGINNCVPGDHIHLGLSFSHAATPAVRALVARFDTLAAGKGHFDPGRTIALEHALCRITGQDLRDRDPEPLTPAALLPEIERLAALDMFSIIFNTPLRLPRPAGAKQAGHRYCDEVFFLDHATHSPLGHLLAAVREKITPQCITEGHALDMPLQTETKGCAEVVSLCSPDEVEHEGEWGSGLSITGGGLIWVDIPYGAAPTKTLGGVMGRLHITGQPGAATSERLVLGQYLGAGKNGAFGLGFYTIPELDDVRVIEPLKRGTTLFDRLTLPENLEQALASLPNSSPGPDGLTTGDLRKAGAQLLAGIVRSLGAGTYGPGPTKRYRIPKSDGGARSIVVHNAVDRLVFSAATRVLAPSVDRLLEDCAWAYRAGLNRKGAARALQAAVRDGFSCGIKADIAAFFDSVDTATLGDSLTGLFPGDPLAGAVMSWITASGEPGLPQGNPLSPLLSNLYLARFDRAMLLMGLRIVRYADDFVVLAREGTSPEAVLARVREALGSMRLALREEKTVVVKPGQPISFLGFTITATDVVEDEGPAEDGDWLPLFEEQVLEGTPVYLTGACRGAYCSGPSLVIRDEAQKTFSVAWNQVSRLVVVGRSTFSGGVVYHAVRDGIPVAFIDIMGRLRGRLYPSGYELPSMADLQARFAADKDACLDFSREIVAAKIHNSQVLLSRNGIDEAGLHDLEAQALSAPDLDTLRGYEGTAARLYFSRFAPLVRPLPFEGRVYRPPRGPVNVLLSFGYTLLYNRLGSALREQGFDPRQGFFHQGRGTHDALASDLMEDLRHVVERVVLALVHLKAIGEDSFSTDARGLTRLTGEGFRRFIARWEQTMGAVFALDGRRMSYNAWLDEAALALKRTLMLNVPYKPLRIY